jgi:opacity protein-like surface antigen
MKRIVSGIAVVLMLVCMSGAARAEEEKAEGTGITAGIKTWMNTWKREMNGETIKSNSIVLVGPAVEVEFPQHIFAEASYVVSMSDYKVEDAGVSEEFSRKDLDLAVGYQFNHQVGAFFGYRSSELKEKESGEKETVSGPLLGVRGSVPVNEALSVFGKATYLITKLKAEDAGASTSENAPGFIVEAGVKYEFITHLDGALGYKYETTKTKDTSVKDTFTGFTLEVAYMF